MNYVPMISDKEFYYKRNRLNQLRGFCSVIQCDCCVSRAAVKNNMDQTTFSKQIMALERDLGTQLFDRSKRKRLQLNKEGELFYKEAIGYINGIDGLFQNFNENLKEYNDKHLDIALHQMATTYIFPHILEKMLKIDEFKDLKVTIHNIPRKEAFKKLIDKEIDLAFCIQNVRDTEPQEIETIKSIQSRAYLIFNKSHPLAQKDTITIEDIEKYKFLKRETEIKTLSNINVKISNIAVSGTIPPEALIEIIKHTDNIAITSSVFLGGNNCLNNPNIVVKDIEELLNDKAFFHIMTLKNKSISKPALWVMEELKKLK